MNMAQRFLLADGNWDYASFMNSLVDEFNRNMIISQKNSTVKDEVMRNGDRIWIDEAKYMMEDIESGMNRALKAAGWDKPLTEEHLAQTNWPKFDSFEAKAKKTISEIKDLDWDNSAIREHAKVVAPTNKMIEEAAEKMVRDFDEILKSVLPFPYSVGDVSKRCEFIRHGVKYDSPTYFVVDGVARLVFWDIQQRKVINPITGQLEISMWRPYKILEE